MNRKHNEEHGHTEKAAIPPIVEVGSPALKQPRESSGTELVVPAYALAELAAQMMAISWFWQPDTIQGDGRGCYLFDGRPHLRAVLEAWDLLGRCAVAIGLKNNPGNQLTTKHLLAQRFLSDGAEYEPAKMTIKLARLAVQMLAAGTPRKAAVRKALALLFRAGKQVSGVEPITVAPIPGPGKWPTTLENFYNYIVRARDKGDAQPRFRKYLHAYCNKWYNFLADPSKEEIEKAADDMFHEFQTKGFDKKAWLQHGGEYQHWWAAEVRHKKALAGRAGYDAKIVRKSLHSPKQL